jgi:hypothetical protein
MPKRPPQDNSAWHALKGTIDYFIENTFNDPTLAEAYKIAGIDAWNQLSSGRQRGSPKGEPQPFGDRSGTAASG